MNKVQAVAKQPIEDRLIETGWQMLGLGAAGVVCLLLMGKTIVAPPVFMVLGPVLVVAGWITGLIRSWLS